VTSLESRGRCQQQQLSQPQSPLNTPSKVARTRTHLAERAELSVGQSPHLSCLTAACTGGVGIMIVGGVNTVITRECRGRAQFTPSPPRHVRVEVGGPPPDMHAFACMEYAMHLQRDVRVHNASCFQGLRLARQSEMRRKVMHLCSRMGCHD